ncbi:OmpP1/FadL family transporter [Algibacter pectinivorans]|uniref:Outer membrane protein transport protein (OMPP1/FadL/TodX) n=1 Tax=Algibacter pectinivorans TaxID=870482 RepID=A0A1I1R8Q9_9FLAO|nr:outer membrane protein transport protein [Algibacter pectinivorans]SFD30699.1 Outer membrane protein transport protein (OMPP1/FadL/TodX) [Algibacter pectinivorans]
MKKLNLLGIALLSMSTIYAQDISDAVRFSQNEIQGTARYRALSGAFGALGGDMSAVSANPAGSAVFARSHASFSGSNVAVNNNTNYFNASSSSETSNFDINQGGAVFVFANRNTGSAWKKFTFGIAYERTNNYNNVWGFQNGVNTNSFVIVDDDDNELAPVNSIANYFFQHSEHPTIPVEVGDILLNGRSERQAYESVLNQFGTVHQQVFLGFQSGILGEDPRSNDFGTDINTLYISEAAGGNFTHDYDYFETGYNGKISFNFAAQHKDNLFLGLNLNSHFIDYQHSKSLSETNSNGGAITSIDFDNTISTTGNGFSFQLGGIMKLSQEFRIGLTYDSPIWYSIDDETTQYLDTNVLLDENAIQLGLQSINVFPRYRLKTPAKITGSLAYVFGTQGLISFDYSNKNYGKTKFTPDADYMDLNAGISDVLTSASTYRFGAEYKVKQLSFRGGYRFEESPYEDGITVGDLTGFSLGLGYNFGNTKLDLTYDKWDREDETPLYNLGLIDTANVNRGNSNITLTLGFNI